jgi:ABC-2 type transport system permease protein
MTTIELAPMAPPEPRRTTVPEPRPAGFVADTITIAGRALRGVTRDLEAVMPPIFIALFFFLVNIATLENLTENQIAGFDFKAFQLPTAILLGVTGVSRAPALVLDVQNGYFDRLLVTPVRRLAILLGHLAADVTVACVLIVPITAVGFLIGIRFETGPLGVLAFIALGALWSLAFSGFGYAIALKTGNPAAVNSSLLLFFPFLFLTSSYVPRDQLSGWLGVVAAWNPVTYLLEGLRSLVLDGWDWSALGKALLAIAVVGAVSMTLCFGALRGRLRQR